MMDISILQISENIGQLPWDPSATHFPISWVIVENIVLRTMTHIEFYSNFINIDSTIVMDSLFNLLFHCLSYYTSWTSILMFINDDLSFIFKSFNPFIHSFHTGCSFFFRFQVSYPLTTKNK